MKKFWFVILSLFFASANAVESSDSADDAVDPLLEETVFHVLLGDIALGQGNFPLALEIWSRLAFKTENEIALQRAADLAIAFHDNDLARKIVELWRTKNPDSDKAKEVRLKVLLAQKDLKEFKKQLAAELKNYPEKRERLIKTLPALLLLNHNNIKKDLQAMVFELTEPYLNLTSTHLVRAQMAGMAEDLALTEREVDILLNIDPQNEEGIILKSALYFEKDKQKSADILKDYLKRYGDSVRVQLTYLRILIIQGDLKNAVEVFNQIEPKKDHLDSLYTITLLLLQRNYFKEGRLFLDALEKIENVNLSQIYYLKAQVAIEEKKNEEAIFYLNKVVRQENNIQQYLLARAQLAKLLADVGQMTQARAKLFTSDVFSESEIVHLKLIEVQILRDKGLEKEALNTLKASEKKFPKNLDIKYELAISADRLNDLKMMERYLKAILKIKPDHAHALNALGYALADRGIRLKEAQRLIQKSLKLEKENPYILDSLGWVYFKQGKLKESLSVLRKAFKLKEDAEIATHLTEVLYSLNEKEEGNAIIQKAIEKEPEHPAIQKFLKRFPR